MNDLPAHITELDRLFDTALAAMDAARGAKREIDAQLRALTCYQYDDLAWEPDSRDLIEKEVRNFAGIVVRIATSLLSGRGARLELDTDEHLASYRDAERSIRDRRRHDYDTTVEQMMAEIEAAWRRFRPSTLWAEIAARFSPEEVTHQAHARAAHRLVETFDLVRRPEPRTVKGRMELEIYVRTERCRGGLSLRWEDQRLHQFAEAFETFVVACFPEDGAGLAGVGHALARTKEVALRQRLDLGADVEAVVFLSSIKVYLPADVAAGLNQFVTAHAAAAFERRSRDA